MRPYLNAGDRYDVAEGGMIVAKKLREVMQEHCSDQKLLPLVSKTLQSYEVAAVSVTGSLSLSLSLSRALSLSLSFSLSLTLALFH